jgi:hypothetical protein
LRYIARRHDALTIAESIAEFGFFPSEPLIVITEEDEERLLVAEGNRRLAALRGLTDLALRETFTNPQRWNAAADQAGLTPELTVPVIRATSRDAARPLIGYRHVAGIQKWDSYPKARFVAQMIDDGMSFEEAAERAALSPSAARSFYRNYAILRQANESFNLDVESVEDRFGVFTAALNRVAIRDYIAAPPPAAVVPIGGEEEPRWPLPAESGDKLRTLIGWLYGADDSEPAIEESRDLRRLAAVLGDEDGRAALERAPNLERAEAAAGLHAARLVEKLERARVALEAAVGEAEGAEGREELLHLTNQILALVNELRAAFQ